ncbi:gypsy/ty3 retroelement polyprotein [Tanacetum coccineum]
MAVSTRSTINDGDPSTEDPTRLAEMRNLDGDMRGNSQFSIVTKIEFPKFGGEDVRGWLFKCEQFFKVDNIAENNKVNLVLIHLFDLALMWHRKFVRFVGEDVGWTIYRNAILKRFDMLYDYSLGELKKLKQTTNVQEYIDAFDRLLCRIGLDEAQYISFFLAGLNSEIELAVRMFKPRTMAEVYGLCKLEEEKINAVKQKSKAPILPTPRKQLTQKELEEKRAKNQCFYYDQKYTPGHKCSGQVYSLEVLGDTETELMDDQLEEDVLETEEVIEYSPHISLNAINDLNTAKKLGCQMTSTCPFQMEVAGGHHLTSNYMCKAFWWKLYGEEFSTGIMIIPLGGYEMVLRIHWLSTLGNIISNFKELRMEFKHNGRKVVLRGTYKSELQWIQGRKIVIQTPRMELSSMILCVYPTTTLNMLVVEETKEVPEVISTLIANFTDVFAIPTVLPPSRPCDHKIPLKDGTFPINSRPYNTTPTKKDVIELWKLNNATIKDKFPILVIEELIDELQGSQFFIKLDLRSGYHQIRMHSNDVEKTAFKSYEGHYEFLVMPFGLTNEPFTFQVLMNSVFKSYLRKFVLVFFDDILVYSLTLEDHVKHLEVVLQALRQNTLYAKQSTCVFGTKQVEYLGHVITKKGVATDGSKIEAMKNWQSYNIENSYGDSWGLDGYYWKIHLSGLCSYQLKQAMSAAPVLKLPNFDELFVIETNASHTGIRVVLQQGGHQWLIISQEHSCPDIRQLLIMIKSLLAVIQPEINGEECQTNKPDLSAYLGLLQPLPIPKLVWSEISMDFIEGLPFSYGKTIIFVVVDRLREKPKTWSKWVSFAEYWYNTSYHTYINTTPYEVLYDQPPPNPIAYVQGRGFPPAVLEIISDHLSLIITNSDILLLFITHKWLMLQWKDLDKNKHSKGPESSNAGRERNLDGGQFVRFLGEDVGWTVYRNAILKRFDMLYDDPLGELKKLKQTTNMQEYIDAFDRLLCRIGLDEAQCISFFLVGLNSEIELAVRMFKPRTMAEVYELCKLKEAKMNVVNQKSRAPILPTPSAQVYSLEILGDTETELMDDQLEEDVLEIEEVIEYSPHISLNAINAINDRLSQKVSTLQAQVTGEERIKAAFEEFKKYEDDRVNSRCAEIDARLDALSIDFDEELYPHMLTAIVGRQWIIRYGLRLVVMKCAESLKLRHVFADVVFAGIAKGMSEGLKHEVEHGKAKLDLEAIEAYDPKADTKYVTALHALKDLKYPLVDQLEKLKDAPIDLIMASLYLESNSREDTPQWICELRPISSQLKIPVYPEVRDPKDPWSFKEEILLEDAIAANISHTEKKKKCWVTDAATQTKISKDEASSRLLRSKSLPPMYNLDWP